MSGGNVRRWEDFATPWRGPSYADRALRYDQTVDAVPLGGPLVTLVEVVDWASNGSSDLLVSGWDACYGSYVRLYKEMGRNSDGTPRLAAPVVVENVTGFVTAVPHEGRFDLLSTSRTRSELWLYRNTATAGQPRFAEPEEIPLSADWLHDGEILHVARFVDLDGDGRLVLLVGTDYWGEYWPDGAEWFESGYEPYDAEGNWRGGPLKGHIYLFENESALPHVRLRKGRPLYVGDEPLTVTGMATPTVLQQPGESVASPPSTAALNDSSRTSVFLVCGDFMDRLKLFTTAPNDGVAEADTTKTTEGKELVLPHCIHLPVAVDWNQNDRPDLLVGSESGRIQLLSNAGRGQGPEPLFEHPRELSTAPGLLHAGGLPVPTAHDMTSDGRIDLVVGNSEGEVLLFLNRGDPGAPVFDQPLRIRAGEQPFRVDSPAGSIQGPTETKFGYTSPVVADWDGDGVPDILLSDIHGRHLLLRGTPRGPVDFDAPIPLLYETKPLVTVWRVKPAIVRWGPNEPLSYVCLDEQGVLSSFLQGSQQELIYKRRLRFEDGRPIRFTEDFGGGRGRIKICATRWTGAQLYDIVLGTHNRASIPPGSTGAPRHTTGQAGVFLLKNVGTLDEPLFARPQPICYRGEPLQLGMHACAPEAVDWSGTGELDLVVGAEDGTIISFPRSTLSW